MKVAVVILYAILGLALVGAGVFAAFTYICVLGHNCI